MMEKRQLLQQMHWKDWISTCRRLKIDPCFSQLSSKWIKDLNIRPESLKQLHKAVGNILEQTGIGNDFLNRTHCF
jgi:hypothetical protein